MENSSVVSTRDDDEEFIKSLPKTEFGGLVLYQYEGFWSRSYSIQATISCQKHFKYRDGNVLLASKPKTGTTWLESLVFAVINRTLYKPNSQNHPLLSSNPHQLVPFLELSSHTENSSDPECTTNDKKPLLFSTHNPYISLPESVKKNPNSKLVYICRNPHDTFVSHFEFMSSMDHVDETYTKNEAFDGFCKGADVFGPFFDHVLQYWNKSLEKPQNVLFLKYEDLKDDIDFHLKRLADFLGCPFTLEEENAGLVQQIADLCSFKSLKDLDVNKNGHFEAVSNVKFSNRRFFRKGEVGDWVNHFTPEMTERLHKLTEEKLANTGLKFNLYPQI